MKDKIFLIWSGDISTAKKVKRILEDEYRYICIVGGGDSNTTKATLTIGDTVIQQMKECNQAIVIFQKKEDGSVSDNLYFELGFASALYGMKKIHCVRRKGESISLPSDFDNSFVEPIEGKEDDAEYAGNIVKYFISRQKLSVDTNKMYLINNRHIMHNMIQAHYSAAGSKCSDYELAQYILFYMQAGVMFQDDKKILDELCDFKKNHGTEFSIEVTESVNLSIALLEVQTELNNENDVVYLSDEAFRKYYNACNDIVKIIKYDDSGTYDEWARVIATENLAYAFSLYSFNPYISETMRIYLLEKTIAYGRDCLKYIEELIEQSPCAENHDDLGLISVFKAYIYRHLFLASKTVRPEDTKKWLDLSLQERKMLMNTFNNNTVDSKLYKNFEMEYYLGLIEYLDYYDKDSIDPFEYTLYLSDIDSYISRIKKENHVHAYVHKIANQRSSLQ